MKRITVSLGDRSYPICIGEGIRTRAAETLCEVFRPTSVALISHPRIAELYADDILAGFRSLSIPAHLITVPAGERRKNLQTVRRLYGNLLEARLDRKSALITLGGGVLGDIGGFVAATYLRGIAFAQIPTSLLAQVDASIGGKTGVDLPQGKNLIGAFHQPAAVIVDVETLKSLPAREYRSGLAEVIKYGIICDKRFFDELNAQLPRLLRRDNNSVSAAVVRSCEIKAAIVGEDETEQGKRAILNFGHTVGHALEAVTSYRKYKHGEAIAIGMVSAAIVGEELGVASAHTTCEIASTLRQAGFSNRFPEDVNVDELIEAMGRDKKTVEGKLTFVLVPEVGTAMPHPAVPLRAVRSALARQREMS